MTTPEPRRVDPAIERDLAEALGAAPETAAAAVSAVIAGGLLEHGVVVIAAVAAARGGVELRDGLAILAADGAPRGISEYELRTAAEEGEDDLDRAREQAMRTGAVVEGPWQRLLHPAATTDRHDTPLSASVASQPVRSPFHIHPDGL